MNMETNKDTDTNMDTDTEHMGCHLYWYSDECLESREKSAWKNCSKIQ
jgi:hypothetical protein